MYARDHMPYFRDLCQAKSVKRCPGDLFRQQMGWHVRKRRGARQKKISLDTAPGAGRWRVVDGA